MKEGLKILNIEKTLELFYDDPQIVSKLSDYFFKVIPFEHPSLLFCCIGTDRSTGDALGPLIGHQLIQDFAFPFPIFGTLEKPLHALNLKDTLNSIHDTYQSPYIIAIDACLSSENQIGKILVHQGPLFPGLAVQKDLPPIGQLSIKGIVNKTSILQAAVLQTTRLYLTTKMSFTIAKALQIAWQHHLLNTKQHAYNNPNDYNTRKQISYTDFRQSRYI